MKKLGKKLYELKESEQLVFVNGIGKRKSPLQKSIETLEEYLKRLKEYTNKRVNRSIQVEGLFGNLKLAMQFRRHLSKGTSNVLAESTLLAMARNINKLYNKIQI